MDKLESFDPNLYTDNQISILIQKGYTPDVKKELQNKVISTVIQNTNFVENNKDVAPKLSKMISKEHIDVLNKYAGLKTQVKKINDISSKKLEAENKYLINLLKQNEQVLSNINNKLDYTINSFTNKTIKNSITNKTIKNSISNKTIKNSISNKTIKNRITNKETSICKKPKQTSICKTPKQTSICKTPKQTSICKTPKQTSICKTPKQTNICKTPKQTNICKTTKEMFA
jgi:hypothetical protein